MDLLALIFYGTANILMVLYYLLGGKGRFYEFPFWAGMIAVGWFLPQAVGGYHFAGEFPVGSYRDGLLFAGLCSLALWIGYERSVGRMVNNKSWLAAPFDAEKLFYVGAFLSLFGFFFQWKLWNLPEEMLAQSQWSGATVKYLFLASVFKFGFLTLWLLYISQPKLVVPRLLVFIVPCLLFLLQAALLRGRRSEMMNLFSYLAVSVWLVRRISIPRWAVSTMLVLGLILINAIGTYRNIMENKELSMSERIKSAANADYLSSSTESVRKQGAEFPNYIIYRHIHAVTGNYDFGIVHWNRFVFNYFPAQLVGRELKESLYLEPTNKNISKEAEEMFGHTQKTGSTNTGYKDPFGSFGWFGFIKFGIIGSIMGVLYRHAMKGNFLGQLLYLYILTMAMQTITHGTNDTLVRVWVYFFLLCYPALYWAKSKRKQPLVPSTQEIFPALNGGAQ